MDCKTFRDRVVDLFDRDADPQLRAACERHAVQCGACRRYYEDLQAAARLLSPRHSPVGAASRPSVPRRRWQKAAAAAAGVAFLSGVALAAVALLAHRGAEAEAPVAVAATPQATADAAGASPVYFDDVRLDSILTTVAAHYGKAVCFRGDGARSMKFIMAWRPEAPLADFIDGLNMFDGLQLSLQRDTIVVEATDGKEDLP